MTRASKQREGEREGSMVREKEERGKDCREGREGRVLGEGGDEQRKDKMINRGSVVGGAREERGERAVPCI